VETAGAMHDARADWCSVQNDGASSWPLFLFFLLWLETGACKTGRSRTNLLVSPVPSFLAMKWMSQKQISTESLVM
jgi:hypothetical protein